MDEDKGYVNPQLLISPKTLIEKLGDESICIVDTRPTHEYAAGHIPGAIHLDLYSLSLNDTSEKPFKAFIWTIAYLLRQRGLIRPKQSSGTKISQASAPQGDFGSANISGTRMSAC